MSLTYPYPLAFLSDHLKAGEVTLDLMRSDEQSGSGDGRFWSAELAPPIWQIRASLAARSAAEARAINARFFALDGGAKSFLFRVPGYVPAHEGDPGTDVTLAAVSEDGQEIDLAGLPPQYVIEAGDRFSIAWGTGRQYFGSFAEASVASGSGAVAACAVRPFLPFGILTGAAVEMAAPVIKVFVPPGGFSPFSEQAGLISASTSLTLLQRI